MKYPKIVFKLMTLEDNIDLIKWAYFENNDSIDIHDYVIEYFPLLKTINNDLSKEEIYKIIEKVVSDDYHLYEDRIKIEVQRYNKIWEKYNDRYFKTLSNFLNIELLNDTLEIVCDVGLTPTYPRNIKTLSFSLGMGINDNDLVRICAHETCHFLWFMKWQELFPCSSLDEFDAPSIIWKYSEMVVDPILNSKEIYDVTNVKERAYDSFYNLKDKDDNYVMSKLKNIFMEEDTIENKIIKGYEYILSVFKKNKIY